MKNISAGLSRAQQEKRGTKVEIKLYFEQRLGHTDKAYETAINLVTYTNESGGTETYAGRFHAVLEKLDGTRKIIQDYDTGSILGQRVIDTDFTNLR
ncbi:MAG: hypothetical protein WBB45_17310 [Cyclobacteriaceae bacterium]